jgi:molecular chaperone GrpE
MTKNNLSDANDQELEKLKLELAAASQQAAGNLAGWQRAQADYANLKKETESKLANIVEFANAAFMAETLPVYSHFKLAMSHVPENQKDQDWVRGIMQIQKQFQDFFKKYQITEIKTVGEKFDHNVHEATVHEAADGFESDVVFAEVQPGYLLRDKVLIPAKVKVAK